MSKKILKIISMICIIATIGCIIFSIIYLIAECTYKIITVFSLLPASSKILACLEFFGDDRFGLIGILLLIVVMISLLFCMVGNKIISCCNENIKNKGIKIYVPIDDVKCIDKEYCRVYCSYTDPETNELYKFESDYAAVLNKGFLKHKEIYLMPVYFIKNNKSKYVLDWEEAEVLPSEFEEIIKKYNREEIERNDFFDWINDSKRNIRIIKVLQIADGKIEDDKVMEGSKLVDVLWRTDSEVSKICYTSVEQANMNKPNFEIITMQDKFMNIVRECVEAGLGLTINASYGDVDVKIPCNVLEIFLRLDNNYSLYASASK